MRREMSEEYQKAQAELVSGHIAKQDIVITTALIPGRPAPRLISDAQVASMRPGSVIVDLAAEAGGNVEGTVARRTGREARRDDHRRINLARSLAADASALFARNLYNFLSAFWDKEQGRPVLPDDDEIVKAHPPDPERQGRERAAGRRLTAWRTPTSWSIGGGIAGLSAAAALSKHARDGARSRGADRLPLVGPKRDHAPLCAWRPPGPRADARQPAASSTIRLPASATCRSAGGCRCCSCPRGRARGARCARSRDLALRQLERLDAGGVHELCPLLRDDARPRHRRSQRHPPRSARAASRQSAPASRSAAERWRPARESRRSSAQVERLDRRDRAGRAIFRADADQRRGGLGG